MALLLPRKRAFSERISWLLVSTRVTLPFRPTDLRARNRKFASDVSLSPTIFRRKITKLERVLETATSEASDHSKREDEGHCRNPL